jgi:GT2 family glycosyltransferase
MSKLSILLAHYDESDSRLPYLKLCLASLRKQSFQDFEIILVSSGKVLELENQQNLKIYPFPERLHFPAAIEKAFSLSNGELILLLNNDTVLDTDFLGVMVKTMATNLGREFILNGLCNSDAFGFLYYARTGFFNGSDVTYFDRPQYKIEEFPDPTLLFHQYRYEPAVMPISMNPFYATMMKRSTYEKVGGIHPEYKTNLDDLDFSLRAQKLGIMSAVALHAPVFHFGGITSSVTKTTEEEEFNKNLFYSRNK